MTTAIIPYQNSTGILSIIDMNDVDVITGASILPVDIGPIARPSILTVSTVFSEPGVLSVIVMKDGVSRTMQLNSGIALRAGCLYSLSHAVDIGEIINYEYTVNCTANVIKVQTTELQIQSTSSSNIYDTLIAALMITAMVTLGAALTKNM